ncbi:MAG: helix-turn-helix transcriptional regulator [Clostridia bacterium]|nr:helix-turn-helix transcriptional regulator [Clostridia bacterium]
MTVGEKIQYYRKRSGLSQEELGQKMLVSRQTVSLWEMDKTLPTIDNLLRLKEIFSVSIDDILGDGTPPEDVAGDAKETCVFQYKKKDLQEVFKRGRLQLIGRAAIFSLACILLLVIVLVADAHPLPVGVTLGCLFIGLISHIKGYWVYSRAWRKRESKILACRYSYELFDTYFVLRISRGEEVIRMSKIPLDDIEKTVSFGNYLLLQVAGQVHIIIKDALSPDSAFLAFCESTPREEKADTQSAE